MEEVFPIIFGTMMFMVLIWFILLKIIFSKLERSHPEKFKQMGEPSLFMNNSMKTGLATLKFIGKREHNQLNDPALTKLSDFALVFFIIYTVIFFGMFFGVFTVSMQASAI
jgi:hypothetical protein